LNVAAERPWSSLRVNAPSCLVLDLLSSPGRMLPLCLILLAPLDLARSAAASLLVGHGNAAAKNTGRHFNYAHHGQEWHYGQCGSRERQSPIDFGPAAPWNCDVARSPAGCYKGGVYFNYQVIDKGFPLSNLGHKLSADLRGEGYGGVTYNDQWFEIVSIDFHVQAEHTFMGEHLPIELNVVHKNVDSEQLLIVGILFEIPNATHFALLEAQAPSLAKTSEGRMRQSLGKAADATNVAKRMTPATPVSSHVTPLHASNTRLRSASTPNADQRAVRGLARHKEKETATLRRASLASTAVAVSNNGSLRVELLSMSFPGHGGGELHNTGSRLLVVGEVMGRRGSSKGMPVPVTVAGNSGLAHEQDGSSAPEHALIFPHFARGDRLRFSAYDSDGNLLGQSLLRSESIFDSAAAAAATATQSAVSGGGLGFEGDIALLKGSRRSGSLRVKALLPLLPASPADVPLFLQRHEKGHSVDSSHSNREARTVAGEPSHIGAELGIFMKEPLPAGGETKQVGVLGSSDLLTQLVVGATFFEYQGSLTAPPCTEQVTWLVRKDRLTVTKAQFEALRSAILQANSNYGNWRSTMPLMGREVFVRVASFDLPPAPPTPSPHVQQQQSSSRETLMHAEADAQDALRAARDADSLTRSIQAVVPSRPEAMLEAEVSVAQALPAPQGSSLDNQE